MIDHKDSPLLDEIREKDAEINAFGAVVTEDDTLETPLRCVIEVTVLEGAVVIHCNLCLLL